MVRKHKPEPGKLKKGQSEPASIVLHGRTSKGVPIELHFGKHPGKGMDHLASQGIPAESPATSNRAFPSAASKQIYTKSGISISTKLESRKITKKK